MEGIIKLTDDFEIARFYHALGIETVPSEVRYVRIWPQGKGGIKVKVNEYTWSPPIHCEIEIPS